MKPFTTITSKIMPLPRKDVDTDLIIPAQYLTSTSREGYGVNLFRRARDEDPSFPLNLPEYKDAQILVADHNFGCGSSREHAVWALQDFGFRVIIAKSFADIFSGNSAKNGLLLLTLPEEVLDSIVTQARNHPLILTVDLERQEVSLPDGSRVAFTYDPFRKHCLLHGLDDLDYILASRDEISKYRARHESMPQG